MSDDIKRLEGKLDKVLEVIPEIKSDLREHMRRTQLAEERLEDHDKLLDNIIAKHDERFKPLERAHWIWGIVGKALLAVAIGAVIAWLRSVAR